MNTARIVVLVIAVAAGGVAAYLASGSDRVPVIVQEQPKLDTVDVLIAKSDIPMGQSVTADDLQWQSWPAASASANFLRKDKQPNATELIVGSIARFPFIAGEPIREQKLVKGNGSGFMAAILPSGTRGISTEISPETGAGGFILPNDRVDVILSRRDRSGESSGQPDLVSAEIILSNVRVLAIDQTVEEKNGQKVVVGKTATLELKPEQAELLARARQTGTLTLALRSLVDANAPDVCETRRDGINIVRYGVSTPATMQK
ncbi:MAG: Flp pilus assembly protein CpaB [Proteobacteria bacterium SG_bin9]|nr:MAG: Flp pilus assembly protein CpaB [Proteobacteria bacterium SG_bin9]